MDASCCAPVPVPSNGRCPECGQATREVATITLKALLKGEALARLEGSEHRLCPTPACPVVYFGGSAVFQRADLVVPVFQKALEGGRTVCYCYAVDEDQIRQEVRASGVSRSVERIRLLVEARRCACEVRNPQGTCCLGIAMAVVRSVGASPAAPLGGVRQHEQVQTGEQEQGEREQRRVGHPGGRLPL